MESVLTRFESRLGQGLVARCRKRKRLKQWSSVIVAAVVLLLVVRNLGGGGDISREEAKTKADPRESRGVDLDRLLYYIQHPSSLCLSALSLGGSADSLRRVDGDKIVCQNPGPPLRPPCLVYSFGGNDEWSFEESIVNFGCEVFTFDPSLKMNLHQHKPGIWFYPFGISDYNEDRFLLKEMSTWKMRTLDDIMAFLQHENRTLDVLKLDIEGDEWRVLEDLLDKGLFGRIKHLCVEAHLHSGEWARKLALLRRLDSEGGMRLFSSRKNSVTRPRAVPGLANRTEQLFYEMAWFSNRQSSP